MNDKDIEKQPLEDTFKDMFKGTSSGSGEEELLRIASTYSRQLTGYQIKILLLLQMLADMGDVGQRRPLNNFLDKFLELKQYNGSEMFVMKALEFISLRKFLNENSFKINIDKRA